MKTLLINLLCFVSMLSLANAPADSSNNYSRQCFYQAQEELRDMLSGRRPLNYERAIFITENAYCDNSLSYEKFQSVLDAQTAIIRGLAVSMDASDTMHFKDTWMEPASQKKAKYRQLAKNAAIFSFMTDTTYYASGNGIQVHYPFKYSNTDPTGSISWGNSQVIALLSPYKPKGNCYAMTSLYKIFAERMKADASIVTAPGHIFIEHLDREGRSYNVELATASFPGNGSLATLTYTTDRALKSGLSMRTLDLKQSIGLCLVYLAKGYEHRFKESSSPFMLDCAELCLGYDSLNLNALLLKQEVMEAALIRDMGSKGINSFSQALMDNSLKRQCREYEKLVTFLYDKGYKEMPTEMKNIILSTLNGDGQVVIGQDHTPQPFKDIGKKTRYATLSNGLFDEMILDKPIEKVSRTEFDTRQKKVIRFTEKDTTYNNYPFDPVVFAWSVDPAFKKYPSISPYAGFGCNPLTFVDNSGATLEVAGMLNMAITDIFSIIPPESHSLFQIQNEHLIINKTEYAARMEKGEGISEDAGTALLLALVQSEKNYRYEVNDNDKGVAVTETFGIINKSVTPRMSYNKSGENLDKGLDGHVIIRPDAKFYDTENGIDIEEKRGSVVFHELQENFERTENKLQYYYLLQNGKEDKNKPGAHQTAIDKAKYAIPNIQDETPGKVDKVKIQHDDSNQ